MPQPLHHLQQQPQQRHSGARTQWCHACCHLLPAAGQSSGHRRCCRPQQLRELPMPPHAAAPVADSVEAARAVCVAAASLPAAGRGFRQQPGHPHQSRCCHQLAGAGQGAACAALVRGGWQQPPPGGMCPKAPLLLVASRNASCKAAAAAPGAATAGLGSCWGRHVSAAAAMCHPGPVLQLGRHALVCWHCAGVLAWSAQGCIPQQSGTAAGAAAAQVGGRLRGWLAAAAGHHRHCRLAFAKSAQPRESGGLHSALRPLQHAVLIPQHCHCQSSAAVGQAQSSMGSTGNSCSTRPLVASQASMYGVAARFTQ